MTSSFAKRRHLSVPHSDARQVAPPEESDDDDDEVVVDDVTDAVTQHGSGSVSDCNGKTSPNDSFGTTVSQSSSSHVQHSIDNLLRQNNSQGSSLQHSELIRTFQQPKLDVFSVNQHSRFASDFEGFPPMFPLQFTPDFPLHSPHFASQLWLQYYSSVLRRCVSETSRSAFHAPDAGSSTFRPLTHVDHEAHCHTQAATLLDKTTKDFNELQDEKRVKTANNLSKTATNERNSSREDLTDEISAEILTDDVTTRASRLCNDDVTVNVRMSPDSSSSVKQSQREADC